MSMFDICVCYHNAEKTLWLFSTMKTLLHKMLDRLLWTDKLHMKSVIQDILVIRLSEKTLEDFLQTKWWSGKRKYQLKISIIATDNVKASTLSPFRDTFQQGPAFAIAPTLFGKMRLPSFLEAWSKDHWSPQEFLNQIKQVLDYSLKQRQFCRSLLTTSIVVNTFWQLSISYS